MTTTVKIDQLLLCDSAFYSRDNKLNIIGIFDQIFVPILPTTHSKICIVGFVSGPADSTQQLELSILDPDKKLLLPNQKINVSFGPNGKTYIIYELTNFPIVLSGEYQISINSLASVTLTIHKTGISN